MSDTGTASGALSFDLNNVSLKLPEFWVTNTQVWFAQTEVQFAVHRIFLSLPKFYYCVGALGRSDAAQIVDLIKFCPDEQPNESLTELHTLNPTPSAPFLQTRLLTTAGSPLPCFGARSIPLHFGSQHFSWSFQLAPVSFPILGSDFLSHHALLVDVAGARVLDADSLDILSAFPSPSALDSFCAHWRSGSCSPSTHISSPPMVSLPPLLSMVFSTTYPPSLVLWYSPKLTVLTLIIWPLPRLSFSRWRRLELSAIPLLPGPVLSLWSLSLIGP